MILTNAYQYPEAVMAAAKHNIYKPQENMLRVSELINAPLVRALTMQYWNELRVDVDEVLQSLWGNAWHEYMAQYGKYQAEDERLGASVDGIYLTGLQDVFNVERHSIEDYKTTSAWSLVFGRPEWPKQLNVYAWLRRKHNYHVEKLLVHVFLKDWTKNNAQRYDDYPKRRFVTKDIELWPRDQAEQYIKNRVAIHKAKPEPCTDEERWAKPTRYALKKKGRKSAVKVEDSRDALLAYALDKGFAQATPDKVELKSPYSIEVRAGEHVKCKRYCLARFVCPYNKEKPVSVNSG